MPTIYLRAVPSIIIISLFFFACSGYAQQLKQEDSLDHRFQLGVSAAATIGYRYYIPWDDENFFCDGVVKEEPNSNDSTCSTVSPFYLDLDVSFGVTEGLEIVLPWRIALTERSWDNEKEMLFAPGVRVYFSPEDTVKFFAQVGVNIEIQPHTDLGTRISGGLQIDFNRWIGIKFTVGANLLFFDGFLFQIEGTGGLQIRL